MVGSLELNGNHNSKATEDDCKATSIKIEQFIQADSSGGIGRVNGILIQTLPTAFYPRRRTSKAAVQYPLTCGHTIPSEQNVSHHLCISLCMQNLSQVRKFEHAGLERKPAEYLAEHITELILLTKQRMEEQFVGKLMLEKVALEQEMRTSAFKVGRLGLHALSTS
jgi:hypothetical protein